VWSVFSVGIFWTACAVFRCLIVRDDSPISKHRVPIFLATFLYFGALFGTLFSVPVDERKPLVAYMLLGVGLGAAVITVVEYWIRGRVRGWVDWYGSVATKCMLGGLFAWYAALMAVLCYLCQQIVKPADGRAETLNKARALTVSLWMQTAIVMALYACGFLYSHVKNNTAYKCTHRHVVRQTEYNPVSVSNAVNAVVDVLVLIAAIAAMTCHAWMYQGACWWAAARWSRFRWPANSSWKTVCAKVHFL
jgi:hypothetical protein